MEVEKKFCKKCGQRLYDSSFMGLVKGTPKYEFDDGYYCEKCGKARVEKTRAEK